MSQTRVSDKIGDGIKARSDYYVYQHLTLSGDVFYVGKGSGRRAWWASDRNADWKIAARNGYEVQILFSDLIEIEAYRIEEREISKRIAEGCNLTNKNSGGIGGRGALSGRRRAVFSSMGESFDSVRSAYLSMKALGLQGGSSGLISRCARGDGVSAFGRSWSYEAFPEHPMITGKERSYHEAKIAKSVPVISDKGENFDSMSSAVSYLKKSGHPKADCSAIARCVNGVRKYAYGRMWKCLN